MPYALRSLWLSIIFIAAVPASSDDLLGAAFHGAEVAIFSVDPITGEMSPLVATGSPSLVGGISAFDPIDKRFFFMGGSFLYTVDLRTRGVSRVDLGGSFPLLQFDARTGALYGAAFKSGQVSIFAVDPVTGAMVPLVATGSSSLVGGISAFDPVGRRFFFMGGSLLYTVNLQTGNVSSVSLNGSFPLLQYDSSTGVLYGAAFRLGQVTIFSVDPATGAMVPLVATGSTSRVEGIAAFDPVGQRFFFMGSSSLYVVSIPTQRVTSVELGGRFPLLQFANAPYELPFLDAVAMATLLIALAIAGFTVSRVAA